MNHETLMALTATMPCKTIVIRGKPYMERYFACHSDDGGMWMLHRFLSADPEPHLHTHSFTARSTILCGSYKEQLRPVGTHGGVDRFWYFHAGDVNHIHPEHLHRIVEVVPNTWTLLHVEPGRLPTWEFIGDDGSRQVIQSSGERWYLRYGPRV